MFSRRMGTLAALAATALMLYCTPSLMRSVADASHVRMAQRLRPPRTQLLSVWLLPGRMADKALIRQCCSAFEKETPGVRIFLRNAHPDELTAENAVLPDVVLFETGGLNAPKELLVPLANAETADTSGVLGGVRLALPLWSTPFGLCIPTEWMLPDGGIPWEKLSEPGALRMPEGAALLQCMLLGPPALRNALVSDAPLLERFAQAQPLGQSADPSCTVVPLSPVISDRTRYAALCRDSAPARAFLLSLTKQTGRAASHFLISPSDAQLPNAFAHTAEEIRELLLDALRRGEDPALTLARLQ